MAITFDKSLNTIEISIDVTSITIQELIDAIRDWEDGTDGITVRSVANAYGKQDIGGGAKVGITLELINNWRIHFAERSSWTNCYIYGGNLVAVNTYANDPIKSSAYTNTILAQSSSPTLVYSEGGGGVWTTEEKNIVLSGTSALMSNTTTLLSGTSAIASNVGAVLTGTSAILNNTNTLLSGTSALLTHTSSLLTNTSALLDHTGTIRQANLGHWKLANNQLIMYGDNEAEIARFNLFDQLGEPTMEDVFERVLVV